MNKNIFYQTLIVSVIIQLLTGASEIYALFINVPSDFTIIRELLLLEVSVQVIEGLFYLWLVLNFEHVTDVTPKRYIDWSITTPTMLITLIVYLIYSYHKTKNTTSTLYLFDILSKNASTIIYVLSLNWLMLVFGYIGEKQIIPTTSGILFGFIPFIIYYFLIYVNYVRTPDGLNFFLYFFIFWSLYGVVALFPYYLKNACYNILDLFSKNFFGIFLSYTIITRNY